MSDFNNFVKEQLKRPEVARNFTAWRLIFQLATRTNPLAQKARSDSTGTG